MNATNPVTGPVLQELAQKLPPAAIRQVTDAYLEEPRGLWKGRAGAVLAPGSSAEVAEILKLANRERIAVVPFSGGTGLVGGQTAPDLPDPIVLSTERLNAIRSIDTSENVMIAEAGVILKAARDAVADKGRLFPLMIASEGTARIGGALSTNAGGMNVLRYGNTRDLCLGVEAVLPDGTEIKGLKRLRKDNTGYDIRNLLIGAEGTLGVITAASLRLFPEPQTRVTGFVHVPNPAAALSLLTLAQEHFAETISVFELISGVGFDFLSETMPDIRLPSDARPDWSVLIELGGPRNNRLAEAFEGFFADALDQGIALDGALAQSEAQRDDMIAFREAIPLANRRVGAISSHDISLPLAAVSEFIERASEKLAKAGPFRINCFGHLGDGNLHYNIYPPKGEAREAWRSHRDGMVRIIYDLVAELDGSFSAEHGVGRIKTGDLRHYGDPGRLEAMRRIKQVFDPNGIMNPGVIL